MLVVSAHLRNQEHLKPEDYTRFETGKFEGAVCMWYQDPLEVIALGVDRANCIVRLPDSVFEYGHVEGERWVVDGKFIPSYWDLASEYMKWIQKWAAHGFYRFQLDNEPNETWQEHGMGPDDWSYLMYFMLRDPEFGLLRLIEEAGLWGRVQLGSTPFSVRDKDRWIAASRRWVDACMFLTDHCYWQACGDMEAEWAGGSYHKVYRELALKTDTPWKRVHITESGNSSAQPPSSLSLDACERRQRAEYPLYIEGTSQYDYVGILAFYILGHNGKWDGFDLTPPVCEAIGARPR